MDRPPSVPPDVAHYELRFQSLFDAGRAYAFPCDAGGHVNMEALTDSARESYLYARSVVGLELSVPTVRVCPAHQQPAAPRGHLSR